MSNHARTGGRATSLGRATLVVIALLLALGLVLAWFALGSDSRAPGRGHGPTQEVPSVPAPARDETIAEPLVPAPRAPREHEPELAPFTPTSTPNPAFAGKFGSLRGRIDVTGEAPFPNHWRLVVRPSRTLPERESAVERSQEFLDGRQEFELGGLPLGGYDVSGEAVGFNGQIQPVLLEPGNDNPYVSLRLVPAGVLEGLVLDSEGAPAESVPITIFSVTDGAAREAVSGPDGLYHFDAVPDGPYELLVGRATAPLIPERRPLQFLAPHLTFPDITLPVLGALKVRVVDSLERPIEGVEVIGSGTNGGVVEGHTDWNGTLVTRFLPAGHFRLRLSHAGIGEKFTRRFAVDVVAGETAEAPVRFGP